MPVLYHQYGQEDCPAIHTIGSDGKCLGYNSTSNGCTAFCQVREYFLSFIAHHTILPRAHWADTGFSVTKGTNFYYTTEVPFPNTYCHGPFACTLTQTQQVAITWSAQLSGKFLEAFGAGVSGGWSQATVTAQAKSYQIKLDQGQCGYFTFVPIAKGVW